MSVATDYARAIAYLSRSRLPAYVSFVEQVGAHGIGGAQNENRRIYVHIADGKVVSGFPAPGNAAASNKSGYGDNPFRKNGLFEPSCYTAKDEDTTRWNGQAALRFHLQATCKDDNGITELYTDPQTLRPIAADGTIRDGDSHMTVALEIRYAEAGQYTVPSSIHAHAVGHGWLFWARERVDVDYTGYRFYTPAEYARRQSAKPESTP